MEIQKIDDHELRNFVTEIVSLIEVDGAALAASKERMGRFLIAASVLATTLREIDIDLARLSALKDATEAQVISAMPGQKITEKKLASKMNEEVKAANVNYDIMSAKRQWINTHLKIFENAHIMFRQLTNTSGV